MKHEKSVLIFLFLSLFLITKLSAKETQMAKDTKTALEKYAGMPELQKRGFKLESLDDASTIKEVYNVLLPYMIQDGVPLDNAINFFDYGTYKNYNFKQHYTVHFTDDYGTKEELKKRGYKENEIFAYFSKGKEVYRGGHFSWEKSKPLPELNQNNHPQLPPLVEEKFIYFWPAYWTEQFYPDYWKQAAKKDFIILDLRLDQGGDWPIAQFFDFLEQENFKGELIFIIDESSTTGEYLLSSRMTKWWNGKESPRFKYTAIGENTLGIQSFSGEWGWYKTDNAYFGGIRTEINKWKKYDEGVGAMPDIWADNAEDILKAIQVITGIKDLGKYITAYNSYVYNLVKIAQYNLASPSLPKAFFDIKDNKQFFETFSKFVDLQNRYCEHSLDGVVTTQALWQNLLHLGDPAKGLSANQAIEKLQMILNETCPDNNTVTFPGYYVDKNDKEIPAKIVFKLNVLDSKGADHKLSEKEISDLYKSLEMNFVEIPGKNIKMLNTEVTQKLYENIMGYNPSVYKGSNYPVERVSFIDALYFCNKLSEKFGFSPVYAIDGETDVSKWNISPFDNQFDMDRNITQNKKANGFRLPTNLEWKYAAQGGEKYSYPGSNNLDEVAWYKENSGKASHPVAQKKPNGYGLYDMAGNVFERTWNISKVYLNPEKAYYFVQKNASFGGATTWDSGYCKCNEDSWSCDWTWIDDKAIDTGFRIVISNQNQNQKVISEKEIKKELQVMEKNLVNISDKNMKILKTEVTQKLYESIMGDNPSFNIGDNNPVENVSWYDAIYFCNKLSERAGYKPVYALNGETDVSKWNYQPHNGNWISGKISENTDVQGFRLPSADEWYYAAFGGEYKLYAGSDNIDETAWYDENSGGTSHPVAQKKPNAYGLYDMCGNVAEWFGTEELNSNKPKGTSYYIGPAFSLGGIGYKGNDFSNDLTNCCNEKLPFESECLGFRIVISTGAKKSKTKVQPKETVLSYKDMQITMIEIPGKNITMLQTEVTQKLFESVIGFNPSNSNEQWPTYPVENVSWYDALYFCNKLSEAFGYKPVYAVDGKTDVSKWNYTPFKETIMQGEITQNLKANGFRLPTWDEWQYAARADEKTMFAGSSCLEEVTRYRFIDDVAKRKPNAWGVYDMTGNVDEWVWDSEQPHTRYLCGGSHVHSSLKHGFLRLGSKTAFGARLANWGTGLRVVRSSK